MIIFLRGRSLFLVRTWDFELISGSCIPVGRRHSSDGLVGSVIEMNVIIEEAIASVHHVNDANN